LHGQVDVIAGFEPERLNLKNVSMGKGVTEIVKIVAKDLDKLKISEVTSSKPDQITAELIEQDGRQAVKVTLKAQDKAGRISAQVKAKTNLASPKELQLYIYGQVSPDLVVDRPYVFFSPARISPHADAIARCFGMLAGMVGRSSGIVKIKVSSLGGKPFDIRGVDDPSGVVVGYPEKKDNDWYVYLALAGESVKRRGTLKIKTDRDDQASIDIHYGTGAAVGSRLPRPVPGQTPRGARVFQARPSLGQPGRIKLAPKLRKIPPALKSKLAPVKVVKPGSQK